MSLNTAETAKKIAQACRANVESVAQSYNANMSVNLKLVPGEVSTGCDTILSQASEQPGLFLLFQIGDQALAVLVPVSLSVPQWYRTPDENQAARLQALPMEWSMKLLPTDLETTKFQTIVCGNLKKQLTACGLGDDAHRFDYQALNPMTSVEMGHIQVVWPLSTPRFQNVADFSEATTKAAATDFDDELDDRPPVTQHSTMNRQARVMAVPVPLIVKIAEKRIDMRQLRGLSPGMLITFEKSCDDPLDVYVGRQLLCRGEAVKMGEHFAIKINETNSEAHRPQVVHGL